MNAQKIAVRIVTEYPTNLNDFDITTPLTNRLACTKWSIILIIVLDQVSRQKHHQIDIGSRFLRHQRLV